MKKIIFLIFFHFVFFGHTQNSERTFLSLEKNNYGAKLTTNDGVYHFVFFNDRIVETKFTPQNEQFSSNSHAVVLTPKITSLDILETSDQVILNTSGLKVIVEKSPFQISYLYKENYLISEKLGYVKTDSLETIEFNLTPDEILYGGGERVLGMNRRGHHLELYNKAHYGYENHSELMNYTMPLVLSSQLYMLHFDNAPIGFLDLDSQKNNTLSYKTIKGRKAYQVIAGSAWEEIIDQYTQLTGRQPLPPRWALGNFSSRFGYHSEKEVRNTVQKFLDEKIPLDAVVIDIYWFGKDIKGHMGNLSFLKDSFPSPKKMIRDFKKKGVKTILVTEPFILTTSKRWEEASKNNYLGKDVKGDPFVYDFYFGNTGLIDIFDPKAGRWFWNIYKDLTKDGVSGWWGDLGEPEVHPSDLIHATGTADEVHNIYGHEWAKLIYNGFQKDFPNERPFILMRSGYSGSQRYGLIPWSGDVSRSWGGLQAQPEIALQMGMQGLGYMHSDLGGFAGAETFDPELYTRWLQYGVFQPVFRPHAQEHIAAEPVFHDDKTKLLAKKAIELRYSLLPYNYTMAFKNNQTGIPLMRPVFFEEPKNKNLLVNSQTYLWGDHFLVYPVLESKKATTDIYFPNTSNWFDFYTDEKYEKGKSYSIKIKEDQIPVFVRGGAFIPMIKPIQSTDLYEIKEFELHFFFDPTVAQGEDFLYHDDGKSTQTFEAGKFEKIHFKSTYTANELKISITEEIGKYFNSNKKTAELIIHQISQPTEVIGGAFKYDLATSKLILKIDLKKSTQNLITIKL
ncbi:glycoside hydrolase family 31 protein [Namhaeicola litoreus]|uniref:TIM-barrel domain-containing protein n=1 Tax=Namhaeicola litoreus TaxID=1052145 RepID=A0ABW3Y2S9_9FLAO